MQVRDRGISKVQASDQMKLGHATSTGEAENAVLIFDDLVLHLVA